MKYQSKHVVFKDDEEDYSNNLSDQEDIKDEKLLKLNKKQIFLNKQKERKEYQKMKRINKQIEEIESIRKRLDIETPPCGYYPKLTDNINETTPINLRPKIYFKDLALCYRTHKGLNEDKKYKMTPIQRASIPHSLYNRDVLGASKTGSGKTIAFVIPILEKLFANRWSLLDGLGALVIVPTRELAISVYEVINSIGKFHDFSLGLVIGGNNIDKEKEALFNMNILVGTPGRLIHHFSETPDFNYDNLKILVIDEADKILESGFDAELNEIISYLPKDRQTLMFSATLTKDIKALAKFNLKCPEYISINNIENLAMFNDEEKTSNDILSKINLDLKNDKKLDKKDEKVMLSANDLTPKNLTQYYTLVEAYDKVNILYSFLKTHKNSKILIFLSTCKEVRFFYESFKRMKLGFHFLELHGSQKQNKRTAIFYHFLEKTNCVLFATDVASRGLDFPSVNWVIQVDLPEDIQTYIHRVGRTARYKSSGNSLLFLSKSESEFLSLCESKNISIKKININNDKLVNLQPILRSILSENKDIQYLAQRAIVSYVKSINYNGNKKIFNVKSIDIEKLALSFGLMSKPTLVIKENNQNMKNQSTEENEEEKIKKSKIEKFREKIKKKKLEKKEKDILNNDDLVNNKDETKDDYDDFLKKKRKGINEDEEKKEIVKLQEFTQNTHKKNVVKTVDISERFKKIELELKEKEYDAKQEEKERIKQKHRDQRLLAKAEDYNKHNINKDASENEDNINEQEDEEDDEISVEEVKNKKKSQSSKKDYVKSESIMTKESLAKKILSTKKLLF